MTKKVLIVVNHPRNILTYRLNLISSLKNHGYSVITCAANDDKIALKLKKKNIEFIPIDMQPGGISPIRDIISLFSLLKHIKQISPDIVINYTIKPNIYGSIAARLAKVKNIYSVMTGLGYVFTGNNLKRKFIRFFAKRLYKLAFSQNRKVFFQNQDDLLLFVNKKIVNKEHTVLLNGSGVDINEFPLQQFPDYRCFLLISRLLKDKGVMEYMQAAKIIKQKYPEVKFKLLGSWEDKLNPALIKKNLVDQWKQEGIVDFLETTDDVRPAMGSASVYVLPSYREGTSKSVLEAMAMGRPIITTDVPGCRQTVQHGLNGYLVPARDAEELAAAMERFILRPELISVMGKESRKIAEEKYDVHKVNSVILGTIEMK
ncbi:MAG: glycosyltransferase family 4 protein [Gammaproteobacteria bacterium]|jgi:glycosyltransferase involved in cell wall biosynthesis